MRPLLPALIVAIVFATPTWAQTEPAAAPAPKPVATAPATTDYVMMKVGNQDIAASEVKRMWEGLFPPGSAPDFDSLKPEMRDKVLRGVMTERLLLAEGLKQGIDKSPTVERELAEIRRKLVVKNFLDAKTADVITDAELKAEYDAMVVSMRDEKEIRARHILVADEKDAKEVKKKLDDGKKFAEVAREYSKDPGSAKQGGDLGYFTADKMVKEFADAAFKLKKDEVSAPVKSSFGWHVIQVTDIRKASIPTYNDAKDALRMRLQEKKLNDYIRSLVKQADVKLYDAKGKEVPFTKEAAPVKTGKK